jgi:hypothetical protein
MPPGTFKICGQKFSHPHVTIIGDDKARLNHYMEGLAKHLHSKHPEVGQAMVAAGAAFMELLFLRNFKTTDAELSEQQDRMRWQIHQQTLKARYPDENLREQAEAMAEDIFEEATHNTEGRANISDMLEVAFRSIRDALEEPGKYEAPVQGSAKVLVG